MSLVPVPATTRTRVARRPLGGDLDGRGDEPLALVVAQGGGFAGRAARARGRRCRPGSASGRAGGRRPRRASPSAVNGVTSAVNAPRSRRSAWSGRAGGSSGRRGVRVIGVLLRVWVTGSGGDAGRGEQLVDDGVEGVEAGRARRAVEPVGGGEDPGGVGGRSRAVRRSSTVSPTASKPTRCMPGEAPARIETTSRSSGAGQARVAVDDPPREVARGAGRAVDAWPGGATRRGTGRSPRPAPKSATAASHEPAEQRDAEAEVRRGDGRRAMRRRAAPVDQRPVRGPAGRGDDEVAARRRRARSDVGRDGVGRARPRRRGPRRRASTGSCRPPIGPAEDADVVGRGSAGGVGHGPSQAAVAEDR